MGEYDVLLFFLLSEKRIRTHELCVRTYQVEIRLDFLFFCASVLNQNKDARAVRPYLTSVFHHSWQLYSILPLSTIVLSGRNLRQ